MMAALVTTCAGREALLEATLRSVKAAGFSPVPIGDFPREGARGCFRRALRVAAVMGADPLVVFQDDVLVKPALRWHVRRAFSDSVGVVNFHDCSMDFPLGAPAGDYLLPVAGMEGAQCLLLPRESMEVLLAADPELGGGGPHNVDRWIAAVLSKSRRSKKLVVRRGLVEHVGFQSVCHPTRLNFPRDTQTVDDLPVVGGSNECLVSEAQSGAPAPGETATTMSPS